MSFKTFTLTSARPLPVLVLADTSGSMAADGKIDALNSALRSMIDACASVDGPAAEIHLGVITFGGTAGVHTPLTPATDVSWSDAAASGGTPMGAAFDIARALLEDRDVIPGRAYTPTIVLVSDGQPTDAWAAPLQAFLSSPRASKAARFALGIGNDADADVLRQFLAAPDGRVFRADEAAEIAKFFDFVTMSVASRVQSVNPDALPGFTPDLDEL